MLLLEKPVNARWKVLQFDNETVKRWEVEDLKKKGMNAVYHSSSMLIPDNYGLTCITFSVIAFLD